MLVDDEHSDEYVDEVCDLFKAEDRGESESDGEAMESDSDSDDEDDTKRGKGSKKKSPKDCHSCAY